MAGGQSWRGWGRPAGAALTRRIPRSRGGAVAAAARALARYLRDTPTGPAQAKRSRWRRASVGRGGGALGDRAGAAGLGPRRGAPRRSARLSGLGFADAAARPRPGRLAEWRAGRTARGAARARQLLVEWQKLRAVRARWEQLSARARALSPASRARSASAPPSATRERARALREAALRWMDGSSRPCSRDALVDASPWVAEAALDRRSSRALLPAEAARVRASRAAAALQPLAQDGAHLAALALALQAQATARRRWRRLGPRPRAIPVRSSRTGRAEARAGGAGRAPADARRAARALRGPRKALEARAGGAPSRRARPRAPAAPKERTPRRSGRSAPPIRAPAPPRRCSGSPRAGSRSRSLNATRHRRGRRGRHQLARALAAAERAVHRQGRAPPRARAGLPEVSRREEQRARAAAALKKLGNLSAEALARARERDPGAQVRAVLGAPAWTEKRRRRSCALLQLLHEPRRARAPLDHAGRLRRGAAGGRRVVADGRAQGIACHCNGRSPSCARPANRCTPPGPRRWWWCWATSASSSKRSCTGSPRACPRAR